MFPSRHFATFLPPEYSICYDLYINGVKVDGDYLLVDGGEKVLEAKTYREITEDDIKKFSRLIYLWGCLTVTPPRNTEWGYTS